MHLINTRALSSLAAAALSVTLAACGGSSPSSPAEPSPPARTIFTISGTLMEAPPTQTTPAADVRLDLMLNGSQRASVRSDASGKYRFEGLMAGTYVLRAEADTYDRVEKTVQLTSDTVIDLPMMPRREQRSWLNGELSFTTPVCPGPTPDTRLPCVRRRFETHRAGTITIEMSPVAGESAMPVTVVVFREDPSGAPGERLLTVDTYAGKVRAAGTVEVDGPGAFWLHVLLGPDRRDGYHRGGWFGLNYTFPP